MRFAGLEAKLDTLIETQKIRDQGIVNEFKDHREKQNDHEHRLRALEARKYVEPRTVWVAVGFAVTVAGLVLSLINAIK